MFPPSPAIYGGNRATTPWNRGVVLDLAGLVLLVGLLPFAGCANFVAQGQNAEGVRLYQLGQYQEALQQFQQASYNDPNNADGYYNLGAAYHRLGRLHNQSDDLARAETCYRQALDRDPNHRDCHRGLAVLLAEQGRTDEAFRSIQDWANQRPSLAEPKIELARLYDEFGNRSAAKDRLIEAVTVDPTNARQWTALGKLREETGEYPQALANYQRSLQLDPSQPQVTARVAALQSNLSQPASPAGTPPAAASPAATVASPPQSLR